MKKLVWSSLVILFSLTLAACGDTSETAATNQAASTEKKVEKQDLTEDYKKYAEETALPIEGVESVTKDGDTLTFEFPYNSKFGEYLKQLRSTNQVDGRLKTFFEDRDVKTVVLKSDVGNMILSSKYEVKFKS